MAYKCYCSKERLEALHAEKEGGGYDRYCRDLPEEEVRALLDAGTLHDLLEFHEASGNGATVLTTILDDPTGYGRIIRDREGNVLRIVEQKDANRSELAVQEVNTSVYVFDAAVLARSIAGLKSNNAQGEFYLTDALEMAKADGNVIRKRRYLIPIESGLTIELDLFAAPFEGLILAEVEFPSEEEANAFLPPAWFGEEVTWSTEYHNSTLSQKKF